MPTVAQRSEHCSAKQVGLESVPETFVSVCVTNSPSHVIASIPTLTTSMVQRLRVHSFPVAQEFSVVMEPDGLLQKLGIIFYLDPIQSIPTSSTNSLRRTLILSSYLCFVSKVSWSRTVFQLKLCVNFSRAFYIFSRLHLVTCSIM